MERLYEKIINEEMYLKGVAYYFKKMIKVKKPHISVPSQEVTSSLISKNIISRKDLKVIDREFGYACYEYYRQSFNLNQLDQILFNEVKDRPIIVDLCCGPGATIRKILAHSPEVIYAIDSNERYISLIQHLINQQPESKTSVIPILGDANTLPISNSTTDYVICRVALQYLDVERVLGEVYRILNKGGKFFALVHGSGYILDYMFNRKMIFNKQTVQFCYNTSAKKAIQLNVLGF